MAHIVLEEVSLADAAAGVVAETYIAGIDHRPAGSDGTIVPFRLAVPDAATVIQSRHVYNIRVWLDRDGDGRPGPGDLYSDQSYPVLTRGHGHEVEIRLGA